MSTTSATKNNIFIFRMKIKQKVSIRKHSAITNRVIQSLAFPKIWYYIFKTINILFYSFLINSIFRIFYLIVMHSSIDIDSDSLTKIRENYIFFNFATHINHWLVLKVINIYLKIICFWLQPLKIVFFKNKWKVILLQELSHPHSSSKNQLFTIENSIISSYFNIIILRIKLLVT